MRVKLKIPATSANIGPGFDSLGCALNMYTYLTFEDIDEGFEILGCDERYAGADNLAYTSFMRTVEYIGESSHPVRITIDADVPVSRGLGSSATMIVGGVVGANVLCGSPLSTKEIFKLCNDIEGHPDNIAPALFGGLTASMVADGTPYTVKYSVCPDYYFCAIIPDFKTSTHDARLVLPTELDFRDAVYNVSRVSVMLKAFEDGNDRLLRVAQSDRLHEPYRAKLIDGFDMVKALALTLGAVSFFISGSGSTCIAVTRDPDFGARLAEKVKGFSHEYRIEMLKISENGVEVIDAE